MAKRQAISKRTRFEVFKRDSFKCQYCGKSAPDAILCLDHIKPHSKAGTNTLLNLVTACIECNAGKSDVLLGDNSEVAKQRKQLEDLQERRSQLEMMLKWREAISDIESRKVEIICAHWGQRFKGTNLDRCHGTIQKFLRKHQASEIMDAIDKLSEECGIDENGNALIEDAKTAFSKLASVCRYNALPEDEKQLFYIRGICRNRFYLSASAQQECLAAIRSARSWGASIESLSEVSKSTNSYAQWLDAIDKFIDKMREQESGNV